MFVLVRAMLWSGGASSNFPYITASVCRHPDTRLEKYSPMTQVPSQLRAQSAVLPVC